MDSFHLHCNLSAVELFSQFNDSDTHLRFKGFTPESFKFSHKDKEEQITDFDIYIIKDIKDRVDVEKNGEIFLSDYVVNNYDELVASIYIYLNEHQFNKLILNKE